MKIVVLNGSPKGADSMTMQSVHYLQQLHPQGEFRILHAAQSVRALERDGARFEGLCREVGKADGILWGFPLYYGLVASQYKRFIELLFERGAAAAFSGKHAAALSTSIHFFDQIAHEYVRGIAEDLGCRFTGSFSADMNDLLKPGERARLAGFSEDFLEAIRTGRPATRWSCPLPERHWIYQPGAAAGPSGRPAASGPQDPTGLQDPTGSSGRRSTSSGRRILILSDFRPGQTNLGRMIARLEAAFGGRAETVNLHDLDIKDGCHGCCQCGLDGQCVMEEKDGYIEFYRTRVRAADILVFAAQITDRNLSSKWRQFLDRSFFNNHAPSLQGKQFGFLLSGPLRALPDLRQNLDGWSQMQQANPVDFVTDEVEDAAALDAMIDSLALRLAGAAESGYVPPPNFLGVGGRRIFRDEIWGRLRLVFQADHEAYSKTGFYDFPQRETKQRLQNALIQPLLRIPRVRTEFRRRIRQEMPARHRKLLARLRAQGER
jgi:multimeric flavodoxin WrbA